MAACTVEDVRAYLAAKTRAEDATSIAAGLSLSAVDCAALLAEAMRNGSITRSRKGRYTTPLQAGLLVCKAVAGGSLLFARPVDVEPRSSFAADIRLDMVEEFAWPDDLVLVRLTDAGEKPRGTLVSVACRAHETLTASVVVPERPATEARRKGRAKGRPHRVLPAPEPYAVPTDARFGGRVSLQGDLCGAQNGDIALLRVSHWPDANHDAVAIVDSVIGDSRDVRVKLRAIAASHGLPLAFSEAAAAQAAAMPDSVSDADLQGREDLRELVTFTIDGADAKDFDDAVSLGREGETLLLGVHIADVSHYVAPGAPIDADALERTTSTYLPGLTLPMLPESLSNRLCSLMPGEDRLTLTCHMEIVGSKIASFRVAPSVIRSHARLTYAAVNRLFAGEDSDVPAELHGTLRDMRELSLRLRAAREKRGAIDFELPEPEFDLDASGEPVALRARARADAEKLIEDFMLAANETVARFARECEIPVPYRVHEPPDADRLSALSAFLESMEIPARLTGGVSPSVIREILEQARGTGEEYAVNTAALRAMRRAEYGALPHGHFALAARDYCHFTSPIRRYPDLTVHRMLKAYMAGHLTGALLDRWTRAMPEIARRCSDGENSAALAEREADDLMRARYMSRHLGERFEGVVSGVSRGSIYVSLANTAEGRVPNWTLPEPYEFDPDMRVLIGLRTRDILRIGERVRVRVEIADMQSGYLEFSLLERLDRTDG